MADNESFFEEDEPTPELVKYFSTDLTPTTKDPITDYNGYVDECESILMVIDQRAKDHEPKMALYCARFPVYAILWYIDENDKEYIFGETLKEVLKRLRVVLPIIVGVGRDSQIDWDTDAD
jgi:hypothetical protein